MDLNLCFPGYSWADERRGLSPLQCLAERRHGARACGFHPGYGQARKQEKGGWEKRLRERFSEVRGSL